MCGIHFILDKQQQLDATASAIHRMMQVSAYRGPDAVDTLFITHPRHHVWLGSNRLKITDPHDRANQPFSSADGRYHLLYNGEIYNYYELRNQLLSQGQTFTTQSDTEVLLYWLIQKGTAGITDLNGMFAFVLYDQRTGTVWAARDRCGMKPLYFFEDERYLLLSSEAKSIIASGLVEKAFRAESVAHYCRFKYVDKPHTFFQAVEAFPEGHWRETTGDNTCGQSLTSLSANSTLSRPTTPPSEKTLLSELEELLRDAVLRHVAPDVPTGLFLSGGVDSTLLLALLQKEGVPVMTFSLSHEEQSGSFGTEDYRYARLAAEQYGTYHQEFTISLEQWENAFEDFIQHLDQPVGDSGAFMTFMLAREAQRSVKVVLSGAGADELFAGYHRHWAFYQYLRHYRGVVRSLPWWKGAAQALPAGTPHPWRKQFRLLRKLGQDLTPDPSETFTNFLTFRVFDALFGKATPTRPASPEAYQAEFVESHLRDALDHDRAHYLVSDVLRISDNMSMAQGIEMRLPYLDAALTDWVDQRSATFRLLHGRKWLLNRVLEQYGGRKFTRRRKEGLGLPFGHWLRTRSLAPVEKYLRDPYRPVFRHLDFERVQDWLQGHEQGRVDYSLELWSVLTLSAWISYHFPANN